MNTTSTQPERHFLDRFRRVTSSGAFIAEIDGLRFVAIGTVVLFHLVVNLGIKGASAYAVPTHGDWLAAIARHGFHGVELFFIISGFILASPFAAHHLRGRRPVRLKQYFWRRVTRLEPPYMIAMIALFALHVLIKNESAAGLIPHLGASLVYLHNLIYGTENVINNVAWSLEIEVQFYILVPLISWVFAIRNTVWRRGVIIGAGLVAITLQWLFISESSWMYLSIFRFLHFFLIGFLLADIHLIDWQEKPQKGLTWDIVSVVGWPLLFMVWNFPGSSTSIFTLGREPALEAYLFPVLALFLYIAVFRGTLTNRVFTNIWLTTIGGMCYTIYLFHNQLIGYLINFTKDIVPTSVYAINIMTQGVLVLPVMLGASAVYFLLIEKPCMRKDWPQRLRDRVKLIFARPRKVQPSVSQNP
jgi:peptidoglycan/LPS O-acetylase OafA/YrhL